jgi:hypothetical protein
VIRPALIRFPVNVKESLGDAHSPAVREVARMKQQFPAGNHGRADRHRAGTSVSVPVTSEAVMMAVREHAGSGATGIEIARATGLPENRISEARTILRLAPDLADTVVAGRMSLTRAYRAALARQAGPIDLRAVTDVTVAQMARLLHVYPDTVYRAIRSGDLETDPTRQPTRIPVAAARAYLASLGATSDRQEDLLRPAAAPTARGLSTSTLAGPRDAGGCQPSALRAATTATPPHPHEPRHTPAQRDVAPVPITCPYPIRSADCGGI